MSSESNLAHNGEPQWPVLGRQAGRLAGSVAARGRIERVESLQKMWSKKPSCSTGMLEVGPNVKTPPWPHTKPAMGKALSQNRGRATTHDLSDAADSKRFSRFPIATTPLSDRTP